MLAASPTDTAARGPAAGNSAPQRAPPGCGHSAPMARNLRCCIEQPARVTAVRSAGGDQARDRAAPAGSGRPDPANQSTINTIGGPPRARPLLAPTLPRRARRPMCQFPARCWLSWPPRWCGDPEMARTYPRHKIDSVQRRLRRRARRTTVSSARGIRRRARERPAQKRPIGSSALKAGGQAFGNGRHPCARRSANVRVSGIVIVPLNHSVFLSSLAFYATSVYDSTPALQ